MFLRKYKYTIILVLVVLIVVGYAGWKWYEGRMFWVNNGMADPKFPYHKYSILELARNGSVTDYVPELEEAWKALPTRTTPQETFDMYIQALKDGDIERALSYVEKEDYMEYRKDDPWRLVHFRISEQDRDYLNNIKEEGKLEELIKFLEQVKARVSWNSENIEKNRPSSQTEVYYKFSCIYDESDTCGIGFIKSFYGDWELTSP